MILRIGLQRNSVWGFALGSVELLFERLFEPQGDRASDGSIFPSMGLGPGPGLPWALVPLRGAILVSLPYPPADQKPVQMQHVLIAKVTPCFREPPMVTSGILIKC
jgi:hypothetical protein